MSELPQHLIQQIQLGNVVLFLGAGASWGSKNDKGETIPNGKGLAELIVDKYLGPEYKNAELSYASELAISQSSLFEVQQFIATIFKAFHPEPYHYKIPVFRWKSIFTTNYDLIVEEVYRKTSQPLQELVPVIKNTPKSQIFIHDKVLPYYKIHGCITDINDSEAPLILTPDQFINHKSKRDRLFQDLQDSAYDYPILFVGFSMADYDIRSILNSLSTNLDARVRSYMVGPGVTELERSMWEQKKITAIKMTFSDFLSKVDSATATQFRALTTIKTENTSPIAERFVVEFGTLTPSDGFLKFIEKDIDYIHQNLSAPNTIPKEFYKGYFENWDPIIKNLDVNRRIKDGILSEVLLDETYHNSKQQFLYLLKGNAGSGKSVLLKRLAFDGGTSLERFCVFLKEKELKFENVRQLYAFSKERIYLFVDNLSLLEDELIYTLSKCKKENIPITIIGAERINIWNTECQSLAPFLTQAYHVKYLHDSEINELLALLEKHDSLGTLKTKSREERIAAFSEKASRELLVALYEATNGSKPFEEIIYDEYKSINNIRAQSLYLTVSIFHRLGAEARAGFISRLHDISFHEFKEELFKPLEFIVFDKKNIRINDFVYVTRNKLIADRIFEKVLKTPQDRFDEYIRILKNINVDYESDRLAFVSITNAKKLLEIFPDPDKIRELYRVAEQYGDRSPKLLQQQAIFEMNSPGGSIATAERLIKEAVVASNNDQFIAHTMAELALKKAEAAKYNTEFLHWVEECISTSNKIIKNSKFVGSYPYHTILKAQLQKLKKILSTKDTPSIERAIKDIEKVFALSRQLFPNEQFILETESAFNQLINNTVDARELLEQAFTANKASPYVASRLANFYEKEGNIREATRVIKESLDHSQGDRDLNFKYAMLLEKGREPNYSDISYYLRRSFIAEDSRYQSQFWYGRALYLLNQFIDAKNIFANLAKANVPPDIKRYPEGIIKRNGKPVYFEGTIKIVELSYGFIQRDSFADSIYYYRYEQDYNHNQIWDDLKRGVRVSFKIAFNYAGPVAVEITILQ